MVQLYTGVLGTASSRHCCTASANQLYTGWPLLSVEVQFAYTKICECSNSQIWGSQALWIQSEHSSSGLPRELKTYRYSIPQILRAAYICYQSGAHSTACNSFSSRLLPLGFIAYKSGRAVVNTFIVVNHKGLVLRQIHRGECFGAVLLCDAAPALKFVGVGWAIGDTGPIMEVTATSYTRRGVVWCRAASQALRVATFALVSASIFSARAGTHCKNKGRIF